MTNVILHRTTSKKGQLKQKNRWSIDFVIYEVKCFFFRTSEVEKLKFNKKIHVMKYSFLTLIEKWKQQLKKKQEHFLSFFFRYKKKENKGK